MALHAHFIDVVSIILLCFVQFTKSGDEKASMNTWLL